MRTFSLILFTVPILVPIITNFIFKKSRKYFVLTDELKHEIESISENKHALKILKKYYKVHLYLIISIWFVWVMLAIISGGELIIRNSGINNLIETMNPVLLIVISVIGFFILFILSMGFFTVISRYIIILFLKIKHPEINSGTYIYYSCDTMVIKNGKQISVSKSHNINSIEFEKKWEFYSSIIYLTTIAFILSTIAYLS